MKLLTVEEAYELLMEAKQLHEGPYIEHCLKVGETASKIAKPLGLDENKAKAMGYIHDIGKRIGSTVGHEITGYHYLKDLGYNEAAEICLIHSFLNHDIDCVAGGHLSTDLPEYDFAKTFIQNREYTDYDKIIQLSDLICKTQIMTIEERLIELMLRRGVYDNTQYHIKNALLLKQEIENRLGKNLYSLFPEMLEKYK